MLRPNGNAILRYALALGAAAAAVLARAALHPILESRQPFLTIYPAVLAVALWGGWRPAVVTLAAALPACVALFVEPPLVLLPREPAAWLSPLLAATICAVIIALADAHRSWRLRADGLARRAGKAAESLRESERRFRGMFQQAAVGIGHSDLHGRWTLVNQRLCDLLGYSTEELLGRTVQETIHPDDLPESLDAVRRLIAGESDTHDADCRLVRADGSTVWVHATVSCIRAEPGGQPAYLAALIQDITARKLAQERLQRTTRRLELLAETSAELLRIDDPRGFLDSLFGRLASSLGLEVYIHYEADEESGSLRLAAHGGLDGAVARSIPDVKFGETICGAAAASGTPIVVSDVQHSADPRTELIRSLGITAYACHPLVARGRLMGTVSFGTRGDTAFDADTLALLATVSDQVAIAIDRHRTKAQLAERDARLRFSHAAANAGSWEWDPRTHEIDLTPEAAELLGCAGEIGPRMPDDRVIDSVHPDDRDRIRRELLDAAERAGDVDLQYRIVHPARGLRWIHSRGRAAAGPDGNADRVAGIVLDITDRKLAEEALRFLADAGGVLASSLDYPSTLSRVAEMAVPGFADWCAVDLADEGGPVSRVAIAHADPGKVELAHELKRRFPTCVGAGAAEVIRTGRPQLVTGITEDLIPCVTSNEEFARHIRGLGLRSYICVPLTARGRTLGAITFVAAESGRQYGQDDLALAAELAARAAVAIDNARLYQSQQQSEQQYRALVEQVRDYAIFRIDPSGRPTSWNIGVERVLGFREDEFIGADISPVIFTPEDVAAGVVEAELAEAASSGSASNDRWMRRKGGERFWAMGTTSGLRNENGDLVGFTKVMRDQTQWRLAMDALSESEQRKTAMLESSLDSIVTMDDDGRIVEFNPAAERTFGYTKEAVVGRTVAETIIPPSLRAAHEAGLRRYRESGVGEVIGRRTELTGMRADGSEFPIELAISATRLPSGRRLFTANIRDITDRKIADAELARHRDHLQEILAERTAALDASHQQLRLSERLAALGTLAAGLGHDMGNLLLPLRTRLEAIEAEVADESVRADIEAIRKAAEYLQRLTHGLRLLSLDPDEAQARGAGTDLHDWWPDAEPLLRNALQGNITLRQQFAPGRLTVTLARPGLTQAIFNLVQNAGQAIADQPGGEVTVWAAPADGGASVRIGVTDNGPGMSPEIVRRCLEPFFTTKTRTHATGMGLSLVHAAAQKVGGTLEVRSEVGHGATFVLVLPATAEPRHGDGERRPRAAISLRDPRMSSYVESVLAALDFEAHPGEPRSDDCLWIADAAAARNGALDGFLGAAPDRRIILFAESSSGEDHDDRVVRIGRDLGPRALREAIRAAAPSCVPGRRAMKDGDDR